MSGKRGIPMRESDAFQNRPVSMNPKNNLLEIEEHMYILDDVEKPNVFRNMFPYSEIPKIPFNDRIVPHNMPKDIWITDTTFRDGQQSRAPYTTEQIVKIYDYLHELGGPNGMIRASEFFLYSKKDRDAVYKCMERGYKFPEVTSWIRASKEDFKLVKEIGMKETGILVSCSDYHIFLKLKMTRRQAMDHYLSVIRDCLEEGISPRCHLEDITRADIYGYVVPFCLELMKLMKEYQIPIKVRACDTMGYGVNYPGAVIPRSVQGIIYAIHTHAGVPHELIEWHGHNDFYKAVSNSTTAWLYGCSGVNTSLFGIGERTGNTPLEAMVFEYAQLKGDLNGMNTRVITELAEYYEKEIGYQIPPRTPFVGKNFNVTRAGIHADGLLKNEEIYNIFDTEKFLNRPVLCAISNTSGLAGIAHWLNTYYKLKGDKQVQKEVTDKFSLRGRVFHKLREDILSGKYQEHEELKEVAIGEEMGVSRTPVREAFRQLELEGLIQIIPNKGAYVTGITQKDVKDIYMIRSLLEGLCARWATEHITKEQMEEMEENVYLSKFHAQKGHLEQLAELDNRFHDILYEACDSKMLEHQLKDFHQYVLRVRKKTLASANRGPKSNEEHEQIMEAIKAGNADLAEQLAHQHMINAYDNMVKNGLNEAYAQQDKPQE